MESIMTLARQVLTTTPARWLELTRTLDPELLTLAPAAGEWSALECLQHIVEVERDVFPARVRATLAGQDFPVFDPDSEASQPVTPPSPLALAQEFDRLRRASLAQIATLTEADLDRAGRHSKFGMVTMRETLHMWAAHDLNHTVQAERALMQPFIRGSGPFRFRFADHEVKERGA
jgi:hypothetical protein